MYWELWQTKIFFVAGLTEFFFANHYALKKHMKKLSTHMRVTKSILISTNEHKANSLQSSY